MNEYDKFLTAIDNGEAVILCCYDAMLPSFNVITFRWVLDSVVTREWYAINEQNEVIASVSCNYQSPHRAADEYITLLGRPDENCTPYHKAYDVEKKRLQRVTVAGGFPLYPRLAGYKPDQPAPGGGE